MRTITAVSLLLSLFLMTKMSYAECTEYKIIDHGDSVEAVCVGAPLNDSEKKDLEKLYSQQEEKDKRNAIIDCHAALPRRNQYTKNQLDYEQQLARCKKLEVDLSMYLASKPKKPDYQTTRTTQFDNSAALAAEMQTQQAEMQRQQAEMQRQQAEIQRMQQQQKFNQIWNK